MYNINTQKILAQLEGKMSAQEVVVPISQGLLVRYIGENGNKVEVFRENDTLFELPKYTILECFVSSRFDPRDMPSSIVFRIVWSMDKELEGRMVEIEPDILGKGGFIICECN